MWRKLMWSLVGLSLLGLVGCATTAPQKVPVEEEPWYMATQELKEDIARLEGTVEQLANETTELNKRTTNLDNRLSLLSQAVRSTQEKTIIVPPSQPTFPTQPATGEVQALYNEAMADYESRYFDWAIDKFSRLIRQYPQSSLADNSQYWLAECYYGLEDLPRAIQEFQKVFSYADTEKDDDAQLKLGFCYANMGDATQAIAEFRKLLNLYPDSEFADVARMRIDELSP
jgi:tol-pal system protein YbgF